MANREMHLAPLLPCRKRERSRPGPEEPDHLLMRFSCLLGEDGSLDTNQHRQDHHYPKRASRWLRLRGTPEPKAVAVRTRTASGYTRRPLAGSAMSTAERLQRLSSVPCSGRLTPRERAPRSRPRQSGSSLTSASPF